MKEKINVLLGKTGKVNPRSFHLHLDLIQEIIEYTSFLETTASIANRIYCIRNDIKQQPKCETCNELKIFFSPSIGYNNCKKCHNKSDERIQKIKNTSLQKYGVDWPSKSQNSKQKTKQTNLSKYGTEYTLKNEKIREKIKSTNLSKYGYEVASKCDEIKQKVKQTNLQKRGCEWPTQSPEVLQKIIEKSQKNGNYSTLSNGETVNAYCKKYGKFTHQSLIIYRKFGEQALIDYVENDVKKISTLELEFSELLGINFHNKSPNGMFDNKIYIADFKLNEKVFLDVDGLYWHSEKRKEKNYHAEKRKWYEQQGLRLYQFREDEIKYKKNILKSMLQIDEQIKIRASKCELRIVDNRIAVNFINENHIQGAGPISKYIGLFYKDELVCILGYRKNFKSQFEISRFCSKLNHKIHGGFSKLLKHMTFLTKCSEIYSWCDLRYSNGNVYEKNGFCAVRETLGWSWTDGQIAINRLAYTKTQEAYSLGLYKIYDSGQRLYKLET